MSNQAQSVAEDLMVGAGKLYFHRSDDPHGFHHLGNVEEFTITNDVTTVEKNSSMNKKRELMASVTTAIEPSANITMNEYNPYNMALGLYGTENVHTQASKIVTNEPHTLISVPGIINLEDADGNRYFDVSNVVVSLGTATPASASWSQVGTITGNVTGATITSGTNTDDTLTDGDGTQISVGVGTYTGADPIKFYMVVTDANTVVGQTAGLKIKVQQDVTGTPTTVTFTGTSATETVYVPDSNGIPITVTVDSTNLVTPASTADALNTNFMNWGTVSFTPAVSALVEGRDYIVDAQSLRGGVITIPAKSTLEEGKEVYISYEVPESTFPVVSGGSAGDIAGELLFMGDPNIGGNYIIEAWKVKVTPDGDFTGLISDDFGSFTLNVKFLADYENHPKTPFYKATMVGKSNGTSSSAGKYDPMY